MAVITTATLIVLGVATLVGTGGAVWHACTEDDRAKEKIRQLEAENEQLNSAKNYVSGIKTKLTSAKEYLEAGRNDFKNGGHVLDNQPLAFKEFNGCINTLDGAIANATSLIKDFDATIQQNKKTISSINNQQAETAQKWKEASQKQHEIRGMTRGTTTSSTEKNKPKHR